MAVTIHVQGEELQLPPQRWPSIARDLRWAATDGVVTSRTCSV